MAGVKRAVKSAATKTVKKEVIKTNKVEPSEVKLGETPIEKTSIGLGDVVAKITSAIGIEPCESCLERKAKLNKAYSFLRAVKRDITDEEIEYLKDIESSKKIDNSQKFVNLFNEIFGTRQTACECPSLMRDLLGKLLMQIEYQNIK